MGDRGCFYIALDDLPKDHVLAVQMRGLGYAKEELRPVGTRPRVGHRQHPGPSMRKIEVFILKLVTV